MRIDNTYVRNTVPSRQKSAGKGRGSFGEMLSSGTSAARNRDSVTISSQYIPIEQTAPKPAAPIRPSQSELPVILDTDSMETKLEKLREIAEKTDYTGMSSTEIYSAMWQRYNDAFDGIMPAMFSYVHHKWAPINTQFHNEYMSKVYPVICREVKEKYGLVPGDKDFYDTRRKYTFIVQADMLGYGGMSSEEKEAVIAEKYRGKDTLLDYLKFQGELDMSGALQEKIGFDTAMDFYYTLSCHMELLCFPEYYYSADHTAISDEEFEAALSKRFDPHSFFNSMKDTLINRVTFEGYNFDIKEVMLNSLDDLLSVLDRHWADKEELPVILDTDSMETKLAKLKEIDEKTDYTGMSAKEIYTEIQQRYNNAFGEFINATAFFAHQKWEPVIAQFQNVYVSKISPAIRRETKEKYGLTPGDKAYSDCFRKILVDAQSAALGYEGLSTEEKEAAIAEKYRGKNTLLDFMNMQGELKLSGVLDDKIGPDAAFDFYGDLSHQIRLYCFTESFLSGYGNIPDEEFEAALCRSFDYQGFFNDMKDTIINRMTFEGYNYDIKEVMLNSIDYLLNLLDEHGADKELLK